MTETISTQGKPPITVIPRNNGGWPTSSAATRLSAQTRWRPWFSTYCHRRTPATPSQRPGPDSSG